MLETTPPNDAASPAPEAEPAVLLLAPVGRDAALTARLLERAGMRCEPCRSADAFIERIRGGSAPGVAAAEAVGEREARALAGVLAQLPAWSDPPLILVAGPRPLPPGLRAVVARPNTTLLHRPLKAATLTTAARSAVSDRLRQYAVRDLLRQLEGRARQLQRLALQLTRTEEHERQRLARVLHDDLQQILAGTKFQVELLPRRAEQGGLQQGVARLADLMQQAIETARGLSHELTSPLLQQHGLIPAVGWLADQMQTLHGLDVRVDAEPDAEPDEPEVRVFFYRCAQELLFNVVKHAGVNRADLELRAEGPDTVLAVRDRGRGYEAARGGGSSSGGLGLVSIRERADLLGGRLDIETVPGAGSRFTLTLPRSQRPEAEAGDDGLAHGVTGPRSPDTAAADGRPVTSIAGEAAALRIILADDHRAMRGGLRALLEGEPGVEVVAEARDGAEAVELVSRLKPDVVLMDVSMPGMTGFEATRRIKAQHPATRVIGLSMHADRQTAEKMRQAGAEGYLSKTGAGAALIQAVVADVKRGRPPGGG